MQLDSKNSSIFAVAELFPVPLVDTGDDNDNDLHHDFVDSHLVGSAKDIMDDLSCVCLEVSCCQFLGKIFSIFFLKSPAANFLGIYSQNSVLKSPAANFWGKYSQYSVFSSIRIYWVSKNKFMLNVHAHSKLFLCQFK